MLDLFFFFKVKAWASLKMEMAMGDTHTPMTDIGRESRALILLPRCHLRERSVLAEQGSASTGTLLPEATNLDDPGDELVNRGGGEGADDVETLSPSHSEHQQKCFVRELFNSIWAERCLLGLVGTCLVSSRKFRELQSD